MLWQVSLLVRGEKKFALESERASTRRQHLCETLNIDQIPCSLYSCLAGCNGVNCTIKAIL